MTTKPTPRLGDRVRQTITHEGVVIERPGGGSVIETSSGRCVWLCDDDAATVEVLAPALPPEPCVGSVAIDVHMQGVAATGIRSHRPLVLHRAGRRLAGTEPRVRATAHRLHRGRSPTRRMGARGAPRCRPGRGSFCSRIRAAIAQALGVDAMCVNCGETA